MIFAHSGHTHHTFSQKGHFSNPNFFEELAYSLKTPNSAYKLHLNFFKAIHIFSVNVLINIFKCQVFCQLKDEINQIFLNAIHNSIK